MKEEFYQNTDYIQLPEAWSDWKLTERIGIGSFGDVYLAVRDNKKCAVKVIRIPSDEAERSALLAETKNEVTAQQYLKDLVENYSREIQAMYSLRENPHIVRIEDHSIEELQPFGYQIYIRMELLTSLRDHIAGRYVTEEKAVQIGRDICYALTACEKQRIIHRDIKPDNIFRSEAGTYKLGDFGTVRQMDLSFGTYSAKGTFSFMAPEVYKGDRYDKQADIYSLGIVLYRLMNRNRDPFLDPLKQLVFYQEREDALRSRMEGKPLPKPIDASDKFSQVICKACAYRAEDRYEDAAALKTDLEKVLDPEAAITVSPGDEKSSLPGTEGNIPDTAARIIRGKRSFRAGAAILIALFILAGTTIWYTTRKPAPPTEGVLDQEAGVVAMRQAAADVSPGMEEACRAADELIDEMAQYAMNDMSQFSQYFRNVDEETIDSYFVQLAGFNEYENRMIIPVLEEDGIYALNVIGYRDEVPEEDSPENWDYGIMMFLSEVDGKWVIVGDTSAEEALDRLISGAFPDGYKDLDNTYWASGSLIYLYGNYVYEGFSTSRPMYIWQTDSGDVYLAVDFANGTDANVRFKDLSVRVNDAELGTILSADIEGEVTVEPGKNELMTYRFDSSLIETGSKQWTKEGELVNMITIVLDGAAEEYS